MLEKFPNYVVQHVAVRPHIHDVFIFVVVHRLSTRHVHRHIICRWTCRAESLGEFVESSGRSCTIHLVSQVLGCGKDGMRFKQGEGHRTGTIHLVVAVSFGHT